MKKSILLIILLSFNLSSYSLQDEEIVPKTVLDAFKTKYGDIRSVKWEKDEEGYEAEFKLNSKKTSAVFNSLGEFIHQETQIKTKDLPIEADQALQNLYPGYRIDEIEKVITASGGEFFELEIEVGDETYEVEVNKDGKILDLKKTSDLESKKKDSK